MAVWRRMPLWFIIWLLLPVVAGVAGGVWYLAAGRHEPVVVAMQLSPEEQPEPSAAPAPEPVPKPPAQIPARILATGDLDFPFLAYETFGPGRIALAAPAADGKVAVLVAQYENGKLQPVSRVEEPMGAILDLTRGNLLNNGETQAVVTTEKGFLILVGTERTTRCTWCSPAPLPARPVPNCWRLPRWASGSSTDWTKARTGEQGSPVRPYQLSWYACSTRFQTDSASAWLTSTTFSLIRSGPPSRPTGSSLGWGVSSGSPMPMCSCPFSGFT